MSGFRSAIEVAVSAIAVAAATVAVVIAAVAVVVSRAGRGRRSEKQKGWKTRVHRSKLSR